MRTMNKSIETRILAILLCVALLLGFVPVSRITAVTESEEGKLLTDIGDKDFYINNPTEFYFQTVAGADYGKIVRGSAVFSAPEAIKLLEYWENHGTADTSDDEWLELVGDGFGPATGFPMMDATSKFRVTFKTPGDYTVTAKVVTVDGTEEVCSVTVDVKVSEQRGQIVTDIADKIFKIGEPTEFTFSTVANSDYGKMVKGTANFDAPDAIEKLEYYEITNGNWYELSGDFGPATGFPMMDATSKFRVTFKEKGDYTFTAKIVSADTGNEICSTSTTAHVVGEEAYFATVTPLSGGMVLGESEALELVIEEASLTWSDADAGIGRYVSGWYVGMKVDAPELYTSAVLQQSKYNNRASNLSREDNGFWGEWENEDSSFWAQKDSADDSSSHYIYMWFPITADAFKEYLDAGKALAAQYKFDWDNDGIYEQTITVKVVASDNIVLNKVEQVGFSFDVVAPVDQWVGKTYKNSASGGKGSGDITYSIVSGSQYADINSETGELKFKGIGAVTVRATKAADDVYKSAMAEYTVRSIKYPQEAFNFENSNPNIDVEFKIGKYTNKATGGSGDGAVSYQIVSGSDCASINANTGRLRFIKAGQVTVKATKAADDNYNETSVTYILNITVSDQELLSVDVPESITFDTEAQSVLTVTGGSGTGALKYTIVSGDEYASIDETTGQISTIKAGNITVKIEKLGDSGYNAAIPVTKNIIIERAEQKDFAFEIENPKDITYNDNNNEYSNAAVGGNGNGEISYEITSGLDVADIDKETGKLTIKKAGSVTVKATKAQDNCYNEASATYTLNILHDQPEFSVSDIDLIYGAKQAQITIDENPYRVGDGSYKYEIIETNNIGVSVNNSGLITFTDSERKVGSVTVRVTKEADDKYSSLYKDITVKVSYLTVSKQPTVSGDTKNDSGWYTGTVTVTAPEDYLVSYDNELSTSDWEKSVTFNTAGVNDIKVYLKNTDGEMTDAITLNDIKLDTSAPTDLAISYKTNFWEKVLGGITFGIYEEKNVNVTLTATDTVSTVDFFTYNIGNGDITVNVDEFTSNIAGVATYTFTLPANFRNEISMSATDVAGNESVITKTGRFLVVDSVSPVLTVKFDSSKADGTVQNHNEYNGKIYSNENVTVRFEIKEDNFDLNKNDPLFKIGSTSIALTWELDNDNNIWFAEYLIESEGVYDLVLSYTDASVNVMPEYTKTVIIDRTAPTVSIGYQGDAIVDNIYNPDRVGVISITEANFDAKDVTLNVDVNEGVDISVKNYSAFAQNPNNWENNGEIHTLKLPVFDIDAIYSVDIQYKDLANNISEDHIPDEFIVDKTPAENIKIEYSESIADRILGGITFGLYKGDVVVTVSAEDATSGVDYFELTYTRNDGANNSNKDTYTVKLEADRVGESNVFTATYTIEADARGTVSVTAVDKAINPASKNDLDINKGVIADITAPEWIAPKYEFESGEHREYNGIYYTQGDVTATFTIKEANFDIADKPVVTVDGVARSVEWIQTAQTDEWVGSFTLTECGDHKIKVTFADASENEMPAYEQEVRIDDKAPQLDFIYSNSEAVNVNNYKSDVVGTVVIKEHNFKAEDVDLKIVSKVTDTENAFDNEAYSLYATVDANWKHDGDTHTLVLPEFGVEGMYTVIVNYADLANNSADTYTSEFVLDKTKPTSIKIEYSTPIVGKILESITYGFYKSDVTVTITADDITSGVDYFRYKYIKQYGVSGVNAESSTDWIKLVPGAGNYTSDGETASASFKLDSNARGYITAEVYDRASNCATVSDDDNINVVDTIKPGITVNYVADDKNTIVQYTDANGTTKNSFAEGTVAYFNGDVTAKIVVNEANFKTFEGQTTDSGEVIHNVGILLTKTDDNGKVTKYEYLPRGASQMYSGATPKYITWESNGDIHTFDIKYDSDSEYVLTVTYSDLSMNDAEISGNDGNGGAKTYISKTVTVDKTAPVVNVKYNNTNVVHTLKERDTDVKRDYYDAVQSVTITVNEHNFRADDFVADVTAVDIVGNDIAVENFKAILSNDDNWTSNGNIHTITVNYSVDANYTFDFVYEDLAKNKAAEYAQDAFTVDTTPPKNLTVKYEDSILDMVLGAVTFGFYNAQTKVIITAEDDISGVYYFVYSYVKGKGESEVNAQLLDEKIAEANENFTHSGKVTTTFFTVPKGAVETKNQFNGTVKFTAYDRSENNTEKNDTKRIVVDNIAPTASITYSTPVNSANNISYYAGNIDAKIVIDEANFYSEDVVITVTKDGAGYPVDVKWTDVDADIHNGTFTLTEDGDYTVNVNYKDRSENEMVQYTSNRLTLDTKVPEVSASNIKINTANKDEKYGFTITASDINFDPEEFKPILNATVRNEDGSYEIKTISLGKLKTVEKGKTYSFTVEDLADDAYYSLACTAKDMSGNEYTKIVLDDGKEYDKVEFSINRNGSTFAVDEATNDLVDQYYVYSVNEDIVISEINVDPIKTYVVRLNGKELTEGTDFSTSLFDKSGEWSKRTYVISKDLFKSEGEYSIVVESADKAQNIAYSDVKNLNVSFTVDQTAPVLTISGLEDGGRYQVNEQTVTVIPTDDGGRLYSIKVIVTDANGKVLVNDEGKDISVRFEMSGEEFLNYLSEHDGKVTFTIPEGLENQVHIVCNDCAVNEDGKTNDYNKIFTKVTVSQSGWIIFYANKPLFYGCVAGVVLLIGGIILLSVFLKKKQKNGN